MEKYTALRTIDGDDNGKGNFSPELATAMSEVKIRVSSMRPPAGGEKDETLEAAMADLKLATAKLGNNGLIEKAPESPRYATASNARKLLSPGDMKIGTLKNNVVDEENFRRTLADYISVEGFRSSLREYIAATQLTHKNGTVWTVDSKVLETTALDTDLARIPLKDSKGESMTISMIELFRLLNQNR